MVDYPYGVIATLPRLAYNVQEALGFWTLREDGSERHGNARDRPRRGTPHNPGQVRAEGRYEVPRRGVPGWEVGAHPGCHHQRLGAGRIGESRATSVAR